MALVNRPFIAKPTLLPKCSGCSIRLDYIRKVDGSVQYPPTLAHAAPSKKCNLHSQPAKSGLIRTLSKAQRRAQRAAEHNRLMAEERAWLQEGNEMRAMAPLMTADEVKAMLADADSFYNGIPMMAEAS